MSLVPPPDVWILGKRFTINSEPPWHPTNKKAWMIPEGLMCYERGEILYQHVEGFSFDWTRELILHEVLHAIDHFLGRVDPDRPLGILGEKHTTQAGTTFVGLSEETVRHFSNGLFQVLTDPRNRSFVRWFFQDQAMVFGDKR